MIKMDPALSLSRSSPTPKLAVQGDRGPPITINELVQVIQIKFYLNILYQYVISHYFYTGMYILPKF